MRHAPRAPASLACECLFGINENGHSRFPRLQLAQPRQGNKRSILSLRDSGFSSHSLRSAATMSKRKPSQPGLAADATVAVQFEMPSYGMRTVAAVAVRPVTFFNPPLHLSVNFFKRALSFHGPRARISSAVSVPKQIAEAFIASLLQRQLHDACHCTRPVNATLCCPAITALC
jgi:hypothetical protein